MAVGIEHDPDSGVFSAVESGAVVGRLYYRTGDAGTWHMYSTVVEPSAEGRGVGSALVRSAVAEARAGGHGIVSTCWFVSGWLERHPDGEPV